MIQKSLPLLFFSLLITMSTVAQDKHFTQFYASPLTLNPALAGAFDGTFRVSAIYRDQWRGSLDNPYQTIAAALDTRFPVGDNPRNDDALGIGLSFFSDKVGGIDFNTTQMAVFGAYHKSLDIDTKQFLSLGFQLGVSQRNINYEDLTFNDQFNGTSGYEFPTQEILPKNNFSYLDLALGLYYTVTPNSNFSLHVGGGMHHFNQPNLSFYREDGIETNLFVKYSAQLGSTINTSSRVKVFPRVLFATQGPHMELNIGSNVRILFNDYNSTAFHVGSWVRPVAFDDSGMGLESIVLLAGIEYQNVLFGLSYDLNMHDLQNYQQGQGAFEISIAYLGAYENETIICPTF